VDGACRARESIAATEEEHNEMYMRILLGIAALLMLSCFCMCCCMRNLKMRIQLKTSNTKLSNPDESSVTSRNLKGKDGESTHRKDIEVDEREIQLQIGVNHQD